MKINVFFVAAMATLMAAFMSSCQKNDPDQPSERHWSEDGGLVAADDLLFGEYIGNGDDEFVFVGKQTLKQGTYLLRGWVYIADGAELTIEPGTVIRGDKQSKAALIVERGGKLFAQGTAGAPIVFTSAQPVGQRRPGDWGGLILCGRAKNNQTEQQIEGGPRSKHGGNDDDDCSGALSYVRVEFAGYPFQTDKEINGITFGSVGSGTQIDHVQVSYSNDDSFEWFGGTVNCQYLVAYHGWDDDFDTDNGYSGHVQYGLSVRHSRLADISMSNGFESDNAADGASITPYTSCLFENMLFLGPKYNDPAFVNSVDYIDGGDVYPNNGSSLGRFQAGMHIRRNSHLCCSNAVIVGWPVGVIIDNEKGDCRAAADAGLLALRGIRVVDCDVLASDANKDLRDRLCTSYADKTYDDAQPSWTHTWFLAQPGNAVVSASEVDLTHAWTDGWTCFDPQNEQY